MSMAPYDRRLMGYVFHVRFWSVWILLALSGASGLPQQVAPLTLRDAVAISLGRNPDREVARTEVDLARSGSRLARTALLPNLMFREAVTRGNDPVYVFGTRLRQQGFMQNDFVLNRLNRPTPINDFATHFSGNWMAFDSWHTQFEIRRSDLLVKSYSVAAARSDQSIIFRTVEAYESILFGMRQVEVLQHNAETAKALLFLSETRVEAGLAVDADKLTAAAYLAERQQELIAAQGRVQIALSELEVAMGASIPAGQRLLVPLTERRFDGEPLDQAVDLALKSRPDRQSLALQRDAQSAAVQSAKSAFGPQINTFGSWETDRPSLANSGGNNWIAGAELRIDILPAAKRENLAAARIGLRRADAASASADQQIRMEVTRAYYEHQSAEQMLVVARASMSQSEDSLRILQDRYQAGLATMTDLLRVEDADRQSHANYWQAVFRNTLTYAKLRLAEGTLTQDIAGDLQ